MNLSVLTTSHIESILQCCWQCSYFHHSWSVVHSLYRSTATCWNGISACPKQQKGWRNGNYDYKTIRIQILSHSPWRNKAFSCWQFILTKDYGIHFDIDQQRDTARCNTTSSSNMRREGLYIGTSATNWTTRRIVAYFQYALLRFSQNPNAIHARSPRTIL